MTDLRRLLARLDALYHDSTKHSVYQDIPDFVRQALGYSVATNEQWRGVGTRWEYMRKFLHFDQEKILDVGANTGFFTLNIAKGNPGAVCTALEGNPNHAEFIQEVAAHFHLPNIKVCVQYLDYSALDHLSQFDTVLLYNVLHHAGVDFDSDMVQAKEDLFEYLVGYTEKLKAHCRRLIFQIGYNWGGNKEKPVVDLQDDAGKCLYGCHVLRRAGWTVGSLVLPFRFAAGPFPVVHRDASAAVVEAANAGNDVLFRKLLQKTLDPAMPQFSEFYRRPIFICTH